MPTTNSSKPRNFCPRCGKSCLINKTGNLRKHTCYARVPEAKIVAPKRERAPQDNAPEGFYSGLAFESVFSYRQKAMMLIMAILMLVGSCH